MPRAHRSPTPASSRKNGPVSSSERGHDSEPVATRRLHSAFRVMRYPVLCDSCPIAQPDAFVTLDVLEQPPQRADPAGAPDDPAVQTDAHHARTPFGSHAVEPVERIPAVGEEVVAGAEIAAALQAAVIGVKAIGDYKVSAA
jgi:hypothetical protein